MESKLKQATELSVEDLLNHVEETTEEPLNTVPVDNGISLFLAENEIATGKNKVKRPLLYQFYKAWAKDPVGRTTFNVYMDSFVAEDKNSFYLNKTAIFIHEKLRAIEDSKKQDIIRMPATRNHVEYFFASNAIKKGDFWIHYKMLYTMYRTWCIKNGYKIRFKKIDDFVKMCSVYLVNKETRKGLMYRVDAGILKYLSPEQLRKINGK
jgi:hypothetical protein